MADTLQESSRTNVAPHEQTLSRRDFLQVLAAAPLAFGMALAVPDEALAVTKPKTPRIAAWSPQAKAVKVHWKRVAGVKGYQVRLYNNTKLAKVIKTKATSSTTCLVRGLKSGSFYYARVRAYKVVGGKKVFSAWSPKVMVRTKVQKKLYTSTKSITHASRVYVSRFLAARCLPQEPHEGGYNKSGQLCISCLDPRVFTGSSTYAEHLILIISKTGSIYKGSNTSTSYRVEKRLIK